MNEFKIKLSADNYLVDDHRVNGQRSFPVMAYLDLLARCLRWQYFSLSQIICLKSFSLNEGESLVLNLHYDKQTKQILIFYGEHLQFKAVVEGARVLDIKKSILDTGPQSWVSMDTLYRCTRAAGVVHGEFMQVLGMSQINAQNLRMILRLSLKARSFLNDFYLHPALLDAACLALLAFNYKDEAAIHSPLEIEKVDVYAPITTEEILVHAELKPSPSHLLCCRIQIYSSAGFLLVVLDGVKRQLAALDYFQFDYNYFLKNQAVLSQFNFDKRLPIKHSTRSFTSFNCIIVFLKTEQLTFAKQRFEGLAKQRPVYYIMIDDLIQFERSFASFSTDSELLIYYLAGLELKDLSIFLNLLKTLESFSRLSLCLFTRPNDEFVAPWVGTLKKAYPHWDIDWLDEAPLDEAGIASITKEGPDLPALLALEQFSYQLIKHKLIASGLIWKASTLEFRALKSEYLSYFDALMEQLSAFEKTQSPQDKHQTFTWDNLLQKRLELGKKYPALLPFFNMLSVCAEHLVSILRGQKTIKAVLYPYGQDQFLKALKHYDQHAKANSLFSTVSFGLLAYEKQFGAWHD